jgi:hypothetical protein
MRLPSAVPENPASVHVVFALGADFQVAQQIVGAHAIAVVCDHFIWDWANECRDNQAMHRSLDPDFALPQVDDRISMRVYLELPPHPRNRLESHASP